MEETKELVDKILPRLTKARQERLDFLWQDYLGAVEKVINKLTDEELAATTWITIIYEVKENDENVYRSQNAQLNWQIEDLEYEEENICLGKKNILEKAFKDFEKKADEDKFCNANQFIPEFLFDWNEDRLIVLDFSFESIDIEFRKSENAKYKLVLE